MTFQWEARELIGKHTDRRGALSPKCQASSLNDNAVLSLLRVLIYKPGNKQKEKLTKQSYEQVTRMLPSKDEKSMSVMKSTDGLQNKFIKYLDHILIGTICGNNIPNTAVDD